MQGLEVLCKLLQAAFPDFLSLLRTGPITFGLSDSFVERYWNVTVP